MSKLVPNPMVIVAAIAYVSLIGSATQSRAEMTDSLALPKLSTAPTLENPTPFQSQAKGIDDSMGQINRVSQLRDVFPGDWAYEALRSLIESYGCIAGYPNQTFQGNRSLTRWEFSVGLNACMIQIERMLGENRAVLREDIEKLKRLAQEFATELAVLVRRVDNLEARTDFLESHQFSTTTKMFGNLRTQTNVYFSGDGKAQANTQYSLFLGLLTSFTGKDMLLTAIGSTNTVFPELTSENDGRDVGSTREGTSDTAASGDTGNQVRLLGLEYNFPVGDNLRIDVIAANRYRFSPIFLPQFVPYYSLGRGPASAFSEAPPIYLVGGGSGVSASYEFLESTVLTMTYFSTFSNSPNQGNGLFDGDYIAVAQLNYNPNPGLFLQILYQNGYFAPGNFGFNSGQTFRRNGFVGTALANRFDDAGVLFNEASAVATNAYQIGGYYTITPKISLGGWANLIKARLLGKGDADIWTYSVQAAFPDLFQEGNQGGLILGMEPTLTALRSELPHGSFKNDTSLHIEAYYRYQITNNLSITPSVIWITAPNQDADNKDIIIGGIRTTFEF